MHVESFLHPWNETDLLMVYDLFDVLLNSVASILFRIFESIFIEGIDWSIILFCLFVCLLHLYWVLE
jgi:hypothetical protein